MCVSRRIVAYRFAMIKWKHMLHTVGVLLTFAAASTAHLAVIQSQSYPHRAQW